MIHKYNDKFVFDNSTTALIIIAEMAVFNVAGYLIEVGASSSSWSKQINTNHNTLSTRLHNESITQLEMYQVLSSVSPGLNEVPGAHDDEQQSARVTTSRESTCRNVRPDAPNKNYTIKQYYVDCEQKTNNKICIIAMLCTVCSTLITVVYA